MKKHIYKLAIVFCFALLSFSVSAQQVNTMYFMENVPVRHYLNPAYQPLSNFYLGFPVLGYTQFNVGNNSLTIKDVVYNNNGQTILFLHPNGDKNKFYNTLKISNLFDANAQINLLDFGFRSNRAYWTFSLTEKVDVNMGIPKDFMKLLLYGTPEIENNLYNFKSLGADATLYTEAALGYSKNINDKWSWGTKLKFLYGNFNINYSNQNLDLSAGIDQWTLKG